MPRPVNLPGDHKRDSIQLPEKRKIVAGQTFKPSHTTKKTNDFSHLFFSKISSFFRPVKKIVATTFQTIQFKFSEFFFRFFPNALRKDAIFLGIGNYRGETLLNPIRRQGGSETVTDTVREEFKGIKNKSTHVLVNSITQETIEVPQQFQIDLARGEYKLNGVTIFNNSLFDTESNQEKNIAIFNACKLLKTHFGSQAFLNIGAIMVQTVMADTLVHLREISNAQLIFSNDKLLPSVYEISEVGQNVHLDIKYIFKVINVDKPEGKPLGFIACHKKQIIPRDELSKDWSNFDVDQVAPNSSVIDHYSPYCQTANTARYYYNNF